MALYDFGARSAGVDNARHLAGRRCASQDATVQALFLAALQVAYYTAQANRAAVDAARQAERASQESLNAAEVRYKGRYRHAGRPPEAQTTYSQVVLNRIRAEGEFPERPRRLANAMGFDANQAFVLDDIPALLPDAGFGARHRRPHRRSPPPPPDLAAAEAQYGCRPGGRAGRAAGARPSPSPPGRPGRTSAASPAKAAASA